MRNEFRRESAARGEVIASLRAQVAALQVAAVKAVIPLEALSLVGLDRFAPEVADGIRDGIDAVRAALEMSGGVK